MPHTKFVFSKGCNQGSFFCFKEQICSNTTNICHGKKAVLEVLDQLINFVGVF